MELPDDHLVRMAQRDPADFVHLYDRYLDQVYRYCRRRLPTEQAEDATSITFLNALRAIGTMDPARSGFRAWLFTIAHNALIDQTRDRRHDPIDGLALPDRSPTPDEHIETIDGRWQLDRAIATLPPDQQTVVSLRLAGLTGPEIAEVAGKSHEAVRGLQFRAINRLRRQMTDPAASTRQDRES